MEDYKKVLQDAAEASEKASVDHEKGAVEARARAEAYRDVVKWLDANNLDIVYREDKEEPSVAPEEVDTKEE